MEQYQKKWKNYYEILQINAKAELSQIKTAYRRLALKYHPDITQDPKLTGKMVEVNEAYEILSNPVKRIEYDQALRVKQRPLSSNRSSAENKASKRYSRTRKPYKKRTHYKKKTYSYYRKNSYYRYKPPNYTKSGNSSYTSHSTKDTESSQQQKNNTGTESYIVIRNGLLYFIGGGVFIVVCYLICGGLGIGWIGIISMIMGAHITISEIYDLFRKKKSK